VAKVDVNTGLKFQGDKSMFAKNEWLISLRRKEVAMKARRITIMLVALTMVSVVNAAIVLDFETEDDFVTPLVNGQAIDDEFGNLVNISSTILGSDGHLGPAIFDSTPGGDNDYFGAPDRDLLVGLGNVLILQNDSSPAQTVSGIFDIPNDESDYEDRGAIVFDFTTPVETISVDLIDIDGSSLVEITLTDLYGKQRVYSAGPNWTTDVSIYGDGWETLDLTTLDPQPADASGDPAVVTLNDSGFDRFSVVRMDVAFIGQSTSGALDNVRFVPEPAMVVLLGLGGLFLRRR
jgi:hypothetical protein